ncbi:hypothetical protein MACJ_002230 [Theileria orientalis]|uniref:ubiquitinyl hydrolase 1 n=1 Tax=Theileria orientalis TaxID=68886 RepID=A0A976M5V7_THEOR|nr:hypothetical protein MACJ_002230 [Theileria orientalis]
MTNIKSLGDYIDDDDASPFSYAGGHNSAIGIDGGGHVVNLYADGFVVNNGPFRPLSDPENARFIQDVKNGIAPPELQDGGHEVNVQLVDRQNTYFNPENDKSKTNNTMKHTISKKNSEWCMGDNNTSLRIKLHNGDLINLKISQEATIGDLKHFIARNSPEGVPGVLLYGYPPRVIGFGDSTTLKEADIVNCNVIQNKA